MTGGGGDRRGERGGRGKEREGEEEQREEGKEKTEGEAAGKRMNCNMLQLYVQAFMRIMHGSKREEKLIL